MKMTAWAVLGSLLINLVLGLLVAAVFSVAPVGAAELHGCGAAHSPVHARPGPAPSAPARSHRSYLVEARMGWAVG
jgi:hypothetical protein